MRNTIAVILAASIMLAVPAFATDDGWIGPDQITEESPLWDCATMGNKVCGPGATPLSPYYGEPLEDEVTCDFGDVCEDLVTEEPVAEPEPVVTAEPEPVVTEEPEPVVTPEPCVTGPVIDAG